jgi:hypothetical protein
MLPNDTHVTPHALPRIVRERLTPAQLALPNQTAAQLYRESYLRLIAGEQATPVVGVFGQSASGKSTTVKKLDSALHIHPSIRYTTRPTRSNDDWFERKWKGQSTLVNASEESSDNHPETSHDHKDAVLIPSDTLFAIYNYSNYYGTCAEEVAHMALSRPAGEGVSVLLGKMLDLPNFHEALSNMLPSWPCIPLRLMVDPFQLIDRLERRAAAGQEGRPGEVQERLNVLLPKFIEDQCQIPAYCELYQLMIMYVPVPSEFTRFNVQQVKPLDDEALQGWLPKAIANVRLQAAERAQDILRDRRIPNDALILERDTQKILEDLVLPLSRQAGIPHLYLSGLGGVAAYALDTPTVLAGSALGDGTQIEVALPSGSENSARLDEFRGAIRRAEQVGFGLTTIRVGLGVLITSANGGFSYELPCDHSDQILARSLYLSDTSKIFLLPPEHLLIETLLKWHNSPGDSKLLDGAVALLATQDLDWNVIHKLIFSQTFSTELDTEIAERLRERENALSTVEDTLVAIMSNPEDVCSAIPVAVSKRLVDPSKIVDLPTDSTPTSSLSLTALKQLVMIGQLSSALDALIRHLHKDQLHITHQDFCLLSNGKPSKQLLRFQTALGIFRDFQVGRGDIYVRRDRREQISSFFDRLDTPEPHSTASAAASL